MKCVICDERPATTSYWRGKFFWNYLCHSCREKMRLEDWNESCKGVGESAGLAVRGEGIAGE